VMALLETPKPPSSCDSWSRMSTQARSWFPFFVPKKAHPTKSMASSRIAGHAPARGRLVLLAGALLVHTALFVRAWQPPALGLRAHPHALAPELSPKVQGAQRQRARAPGCGARMRYDRAPRREWKNPLPSRGPRGAKPVPTASDDDMKQFVGILASVRNGNETDIPALLAGKVEFLLSRDIAQLMKRLGSQCANEDERSELTSLFDTVIDFLEQFVSNTALLAESNSQLLREIFEAASAGMQSLDAKMKDMLSGQDPRYTPEFLRFLDSEILRLRRVVAEQVSFESYTYIYIYI
jgi:hypothetical protein